MATWLQKIRTFLPQEILGPLATLYEKIATPGLRQFHQQVASEVTTSLRSGRVLDVGTGPGKLLGEIARQNSDLELTGCDLSRKMLKIAKRFLERNGTAVQDSPSTPENINPGVHLIRADVQDLPFPDNAFDLVVSTLSIHHWRSPAGGIRECLRVTAPGGRCCIYDLRTDIPVKTHAKFVTGQGFRRLVLGWIFKFHGVDPRQYQARMVTSWLDGGAMVKAHVYKAYLMLDIEKPLDKSQNGTICLKNVSSINSVTLQ